MRSRNELYLAKIAGEEVTLPAAPLSRNETYLAYLAGEDVTLPVKILSRVEAYLAKLCGVEVELPPVPLSETELFLAALAGENVELPSPTTRTNTLLATIIENGGIHGATILSTPLMNLETVSFIAPQGITTLADYAFSYDTVIEEVEFPEVTAVSTSCFENCSNLKKAVFTSSIRRLTAAVALMILFRADVHFGSRSSSSFLQPLKDLFPAHCVADANTAFFRFEQFSKQLVDTAVTSGNSTSSITVS